MKIIIFGGGTGKRFWPVSRIDAPKQFLNVVGDKPLLLMSYLRVRKGFDAKDIFISTGEKYADEVRQLIPELPVGNLILEPEMRDTGPAVTLAVTYVSNLFPDEVVATLWSDHVIKDKEIFLDALKFGEQEVKGTGKTIFIAVPPRFASPHRGYIHFGEKIKSSDRNSKVELMKFIQFVEKPTKEVAETYLAEGTYGWNLGYWILNAKRYLDTVASTSPKTAEVCKKMVEEGFSSEAKKEFSSLEKISADYMFAENVKAEDAFCLVADMGWSDVGEWISLKEALQDSNEANVIKGNVQDMNSRDSIIYNYEDAKLVSTIGLDGFVVVNTKDVIAIFRKEDNTKLKEYLKKLEDEGFKNYL